GRPQWGPSVPYCTGCLIIFQQGSGFFINCQHLASRPARPKAPPPPPPQKRNRPPRQSGASARKLWFCRAGRQNCEAPKKSQKQAGGKAPERRRPLWMPSDGSASQRPVLVQFFGKGSLGA